MNSEILVKNILLHSYTKTHAQRCLYLFRKALESILFAEKQASKEITESFLQYVKSTVAEEERFFFLGWSTSFLSSLTQENFSKLLSETEEKLNAIMTIPVWVAYTPGQEIEKKIHVFLSQKIKQDFFVIFNLDEDSIGGFIFEYRGEVFDYSLRKVVRDKKEEIEKIVSAYES